MTKESAGAGDPLWYKDAIIYELHVRAFADSNGDGIGDFPGLTGKLDYLRDLGVNTLWILPFYVSPLKDDGYDISDYTRVHPDYGTLSDFKTFLREAHRRGLRVITELVLNHTSDRHPWFERARRSSPGSRWRKWYVWSDTSDRYRDARVIFKDFEPSNWSWDPVAKAYYWHRFYAHQPDLNYDHPDVHKALFQVVDFWLEMGVDGFRLDAIPYLYEREGTTCDNLPETHEFLRKLRRHVDERYPGRVLLAEANLWPEDAVAYFGRSDECHMAFHFPIMARMFLAVQQEDRFPVEDILAQTPLIPETAQWALFLRNHDELTLEMVTDEERDYMYRSYARERQARINLGIRRRLAPLLQNNRKKIELLNALLFSLPGTPVLYYGDEIGMGDNIFLGDRNGVRTPMQWSGDRNAGFSRANAQRLYLPAIVDPEYHYEAINVEAQQANPQSLLWWMKRLLALSRRFKAFGRGSIELLAPENRKVLAFLRRYQNEVVLVVANLSRFSQYVELDLSSLAGRLPVELFGRTEFPRVGESPTVLTLGPHAFFWFALEPAPETGTALRHKGPGHALEVSRAWTAVFEGKARADLESAFEAHLHGRSWFDARSRHIKSARITEASPLPGALASCAIVFLEVDFAEGEPETYSVPVAFVTGPPADKVRKEMPAEVVAEIRVTGGPEPLEGVLIDGLADPTFSRTAAEWLARRGQVRCATGKILAVPTAQLGELVSPQEPPTLSTVKDTAEHSVAAVGHRLALVWIRKVEEGRNPELEVAQQLAGQTPPLPVSALGGHLEFARKGGGSITLGLFRGIPAGTRDGWSFTQDELGRYFETVRSTPGVSDSPPDLLTVIGHYLEIARKMGEHTARLHRYLMGSGPGPGFAPEPLTPSDQRSIYQALRKKLDRALPLLRRAVKHASPAGSEDPRRLRALEGRLLDFFHSILKKRVSSVRIRCHGDLSLHRFLSVGGDFVLADWSGSWAKSFLERRLKRSPLWDAAGMINSFRRAVNAAFRAQTASGEVAPDRWPILESGAKAWYGSVREQFLKGYLGAMEAGGLPLGAAGETEPLLLAHLLEKVLEEWSLSAVGRPAPAAGPNRELTDLLLLVEECERTLGRAAPSEPRGTVVVGGSPQASAAPGGPPPVSTPDPKGGMKSAAEAPGDGGARKGDPAESPKPKS